MHSSLFKFVCDEPMGVLILFRVRVAVDLCLDAGAVLLFNYAYPLNFMARKCNFSFYKFYCPFSGQSLDPVVCLVTLGQQGPLSLFV
jgi:hypothetical protein